MLHTSPSDSGLKYETSLTRDNDKRVWPVSWPVTPFEYKVFQYKVLFPVLLLLYPLGVSFRPIPQSGRMIPFTKECSGTILSQLDPDGSHDFWTTSTCEVSHTVEWGTLVRDDFLEPPFLLVYVRVVKRRLSFLTFDTNLFCACTCFDTISFNTYERVWMVLRIVTFVSVMVGTSTPRRPEKYVTTTLIFLSCWLKNFEPKKNILIRSRNNRSLI